MSETKSQELPEGRVLFRSITPLPDCWLVGNTTLLPVISGTRHGEDYRVYSVNANGWEQIQSTLFNHWSYDQLSFSREFIDSFTRVMGNQFLVVDCIADDSSETRIMSNSMASVELLSAVINALILHNGALGPYIENTWIIQFPLHSIGRSQSNVSMNRFLCPSKYFATSSSVEFPTTFKALLDQSWGDSQFGRVLNLALDTLSGSLRTLRPAHSFAMLAMTFEILFTKSENDFSGGSKRLARLTGITKGEVTSLHRFFNDDNVDSVRNLRNQVIHGNESIDHEKLKAVREKFAGLLAQAVIFLVQHFSTTAPIGNYYDEMEKLADHRFDRLPTQ